MSPLARRTSAHPVGSGGGRGAAGRNVGTFLQRARSGRGCSARASAGDRAVAAQGGLASLRVALFAATGQVGARPEAECRNGPGVKRRTAPCPIDARLAQRKLLCINGVRSFDATDGRLDRDHVKEGRVAARRKERSTGVRASARQMAEGVSGQVARGSSARERCARDCGSPRLESTIRERRTERVEGPRGILPSDSARSESGYARRLGDRGRPSTTRRARWRLPVSSG